MPSPSPSTGLIVGSGGYATIGAAVAAAPDGATIRIKAGTYPEQLAVAKALTLVAYGDGPVWLDGECARGDTLTITASDVTVRGLGFRMSRGFGVLVNNGAARTTIDGNQFEDWNCANGENYVAAIGAWYAGPGQHVVNNRLTLRVARASASPSNGMYFKSNSTDFASGGGHLIAHNTIIGCWDGIGGANNFDPRGGFDGNTEVAYNDITGCADDGIEAEGGSTNVWIHDNTIRESGVGVALAGVHGGPITVERNTIISSTAGTYGTMDCFKVGASLGGGPLIIRDNVCHVGLGKTDGSGAGQGIAQTNSYVAIMVVSGNRWDVDRYVYELTSFPPDGSSFDGNCLWTADTTRFVKWGGTRYYDLPSFRAATGQESHGMMGPCP